MIGHHISGRSPISLDAAIAYARAFGLPLEKISPRLAQEVQGAAKHISSHESSSSHDEVPLISWKGVSAGYGNTMPGDLGPSEIERWIPCPAPHGPHTVALRVSGESMYNPNGRPSYSPGDIIFMDPDCEARAGDRVVVRVGGGALFKQLVVEPDGHRLLKALNPDFKPRLMEFDEEAEIIGVVLVPVISEQK